MRTEELVSCMLEFMNKWNWGFGSGIVHVSIWSVEGASSDMKADPIPDVSACVDKVFMIMGGF